MIYFIIGLAIAPAIAVIYTLVERMLIKSKRIRRIPTNLLTKEKNLPVRYLFGRLFWKDGILIIGSRFPTAEEKEIIKRG